MASAKGPVPQANDCVWQVDHLQSLTAPPSSFPYNPDAVLNWDVTDFRVEGKSLWWGFVISFAKKETYGFGFSFELPFMYCFHKTLPGEHIKALVGT